MTVYRQVIMIELNFSAVGSNGVRFFTTSVEPTPREITEPIAKMTFKHMLAHRVCMMCSCTPCEKLH